jgi:D-alanyl-D-alanine carboxypeptidase/D-alanyl-D-alanine-endopeptidase (penicillin-binding protein 4)
MTRLRLAVLASTALLATGAAATSSDAAGTDLGAALGRALAAEGIDPRLTGALVVDLRTGAVVFAQNASTALRPASAEKLAVSFAALRILGPGYRFRTEIVGRGELHAGTWRGDLLLVGHGDPTLDPGDIDTLARQVRGWGIRRVAGRVLGDESHFDSRRDAPGWKPGFAGIESRPLSALSVEGVLVRRIDGSAARAAQVLTAALEHRGVSVDGPPGTGRAPGDGLSIASDLSEPLDSIIRRTNRESDNYYAEVLLKELGAAVAGQGTSIAGSRVVLAELRRAKVPVTGLRIADGSGLSLDDRLTARALVAILRAGTGDESFGGAFLSSLAVAGVSGTLEERLATRPTFGRVVAKTGTTNAASALAGFVRKRYVFAIVQNGSPVPYWTARVAQDRFVTVLARAK